MTTDPSSDVVERLRKRIERYETGLRVKSFEVGDNPVTDALAGELRNAIATIERLSAELAKAKGAADSNVLVERVAAMLKRQRANRYADEAIAPSDLIDEEDAREIIRAILSGAENVR